MQIGGSGYSVPADIIRSTWLDDRALNEHLLRYSHILTQQLAHSVIANAKYTASARLARWLLMCHDRVDCDNLSITHDFLSALLGVRRSWVTAQVHVLEGLQAIRATRGNIRILDRSKLVRIAGACYGEPERLYEDLIRPDSALADPVSQVHPTHTRILCGRLRAHGQKTQAFDDKGPNR